MALHAFDIPRRHRRCVSGNEDFTHGQSYYSLIEPSEEGYMRKDYCPACWQNVQEPEGKIFWKSSIPEKQQASAEAMRKDERALELLKEYRSSKCREEQNQAFILALLLTRKKLLQLRQEIEEDEGSVQLYEVRSTEEIIGVKKVDLSSIQADLIQTALTSALVPNYENF